MKNKKMLWSFFIAIIIVVGCVGFYRYRQVNAHPQQYGVTKEQLFRKNELVKAYHVDFIVHKAAVKKSKDAVQAKVKFNIRQTGQSFYGEKKNNPNFRENMYLNNPYGTSSPSIKLYDKSHHSINPDKALAHGKQPFTIFFTIPRYSYDMRNQKLRFSFVVPTKKHYVKYSLLLE